ncbi:MULTISPECIES: sulfatase-like hydrolase/transferase [Bacteroides]|jgi:hypothetical protein|uniref:Arylsulfatase n=1 Tax=Bacteroides eggerthii TaxID=28111 RepID=A0A380Z8M7_9BACE|nr:MULTISPECIES: sulfatase-like hydrolase/transferase [Bacteroides]EEC55609.1 putative choline-sulfatase [Bacteroides eggerthii DSM 20697]MBU8972118.1 sulfatase-like hydrolase/transferase [Bacteroides eggerthii]MBU8996739.1 sulfatase-like hydrolase/transferase [Bacteroides eggerthii]MCG4758196.1 sulfatase-like hydrolase/transferase [Bacteroides eggerthii]QRQ49707.1 sulfatase-like hydrolase/transferase [Bacteroides eggerthii]
MPYLLDFWTAFLLIYLFTFMKNVLHSYFTQKMGIKIGISILGYTIGGTIDLIAQNAKQENCRPNIVLIISDEHNGNIMGCMGDPYIHTPNLDALAENGILFKSHYCASPISGPSRQSLTTGKYVSHHNVWGNTVGCPNDITSLPRIMQQQGYETVLTGGMKYNGLNYGWNSYKANDGYKIAYDKKKKAGTDIAQKRERIKAGVFVNNKEDIGKEFTPMGATDMNLFTDIQRSQDAIAYIKNRAHVKQPFFLLVGLMAPHYPLQATQELVDKYKDKIPMPKIPKGYIENLPLNYKHLRNTRKLENVPKEIVKKARECYYARVEWADSQIGKIIKTINESPMADNTIIIYTSDHGENLGEHGLWWKNCLYDCSAKVPLIISNPKRWKGKQTRSKNTESVDLVQTIADLGGTKVPNDWDGESMLPLLEDSTYNWKDFAICEYYAGYIASGITMYRQGKWKYVYHARMDENHGPEIELYDMDNDPEELTNLARDNQYKMLIQDLHQELICKLGEDPELIEKRYRAGAIPEAPLGIKSE